MQIAQMRALETGRELVRSTNNGVSGFIDHRGHIKSQTAQFVQQTLEDRVQLRRGMTPFMYLGSEPITFFALVLVVMNLIIARRSKLSTKN
jgi:apolipoprotein N-acyltransferase